VAEVTTSADGAEAGGSNAIIPPMFLGYLFFREQINLLGADLSTLIFDPQTMIIGFLLLAGGCSLFTTTLVALGIPSNP
jgi:hypothetical protein